MAKRKIVHGLPVHTRRPGEVAVRVAPSPLAHVLLADGALRRAYTDSHGYALKPGVVCLLPARLFARPDSIGSQLVANGTLVVVDDDKGVVPPVVDLSNARAVAELRTGRSHEVTLQERADHWKSIVVDRSLAECIARCEEAGIDGTEAAKRLAHEYDRAFLEGRGRSRPWEGVAAEMVLAERARQAGLVDDVSQPATER
jgi:hypothetical protein